MMKQTIHWLMATIFVATFGIGMMSCSSDNKNDDEVVYVPQESPLVNLLKTQAVHDTSCEVNKYGQSNFKMTSNPIYDNKKHDYYIVSFCVMGKPIDKKESGKYEIVDIEAQIDGFNTYREYVKNSLKPKERTESSVKGAWVELEYLNETDSYGYRKYKVTLHADELVEENGDYARNINLTYSGFISSGMLKY